MENLELEYLERHHLNDIYWVSAQVMDIGVCLITEKGMGQLLSRLKNLEEQVEYLKGAIEQQ